MAKFLKVGEIFINLDLTREIEIREVQSGNPYKIAYVRYLNHNIDDDGSRFYAEEAEAIERWLMSNADGVEKAEIAS